MTRYLILGPIGSDAGYWTIENGHLVHHDGWEVDRLSEVRAGLAILQAAPQLRTPELAERVTELVTGMLTKELGGHLGEGSHTVVIG
jgi:hypothetical protein